MAHETSTAMICDRCGHTQRFDPSAIPDPEVDVPAGWWRVKCFIDPSDLCGGCKDALLRFLDNATVRPGGSETAENSHG